VHPQIRELLDRVQSTADFGYVSFNSIHDTNVFGDNALHCVCVWGDLEAVQLLVANGINLNQRGEHGFTPVRVAAEFEHKDIVNYLLSQGADPTALDAPEMWDATAFSTHSEILGQQIEKLEAQLLQCEPSERKT
jgi:hypothetical protein